MCMTESYCGYRHINSKIHKADLLQKSMAEPYVSGCCKTIQQVATANTHTPLIKETDGLLARTTTFYRKYRRRLIFLVIS